MRGYLPAALRGVFPVCARTQNQCISFNVENGSVVRLLLDGDSALALKKCLTDYRLRAAQSETGIGEGGARVNFNSNVRMPPRGHFYRGPLIHVIRRFTVRAGIGVFTALQNGFLFFLDTIGANVVKGLPFVFRRIEAVHKIAAWCLPERVALYLGLKFVSLQRLSLEISQFHLKVCIRHARLAYLKRKLRDGHFEICISRHLRFLEKHLQSINKASPVFCCFDGLASKADNLSKALNINGHFLALPRRLNAQRYIRALASQAVNCGPDHEGAAK
ncbi:hypothetical protein AB9F29_16765 [Falsihalocynthiibacter sp. S25ZX9]|uniref:hypothetical protein n=1 Tax=Falsihalocynthiibacter sp. S25ZX9 TaxID=3240870 RepID=UPI0035105967